MPGAPLAADLWISEYISPFDIWQHGIARVLAHRQTPFQEAYVVESGPYGKGLVLDGKWQTCTGDEFLYHEPLVHVPCTLHGAPRRVLVAGGADGGALREVLKWRTVEKAVLADIDGDVIAMCREHLPEVHQGSLDDPRAEVVIGDAWDLIASTPGEWDIILADLTDPIEEGPAYKLFTQEFFQLCQRALRPGGLFVNQAGSQSPPLCAALSRVVHTLQSVFRETGLITAPVPTYGSPWGLALASDRAWDRQPDPAKVDELLAQSLQGAPLRMFDGAMLPALLQAPKYLREACARETVVYTLAAPPQAFGRTATGT